MKKIRPIIFTMLLIAMVMTATACGSSNNNSGQSSNSTSQSATQQSGTAAQETSRVGESGSAAVDGTSEDGGIIDGVVNDIEKGADDVRNDMDNMESTSAGVNANTCSNGANE